MKPSTSTTHTYGTGSFVSHRLASQWTAVEPLDQGKEGRVDRVRSGIEVCKSEGAIEYGI